MNTYRKIWLLSILVLNTQSLLFGWATGGDKDLNFLHVHRDMAKRILNDPEISFYVDSLHLDKASIEHYASIEPQYTMGKHPDWKQFVDRTFLKFKTDEKQLGCLIHSLCDFGVPASHSPSAEVWINQTSERVCEMIMEFYGIPNVKQVYPGTLQEVMTQFKKDQTANAQSYKKWWKKTWYCPFCNPNSFAKEGVKNALKLEIAVLKIYFQVNFPNMQMPALRKATDEMNDSIQLAATDALEEMKLSDPNILFQDHSLLSYNNKDIVTSPDFNPLENTLAESTETGDDNDLSTHQPSLTNSPNPFNPTTTLFYELRTEDQIVIQVYNLLGEEMQTLYQGYAEAGKHELVWDASKYYSGYYLIRLMTSERQITKKCLLVK